MKGGINKIQGGKFKDIVDKIQDEKFENLRLKILPNIHHYYEENLEDFKSIASLEPLLKMILEYYNFSLNSWVIHREKWDESISFHELLKRNDGVCTNGDLIDQLNNLNTQERITLFGIYIYGNICLKIISKLKKYALEFADEEFSKQIKEVAKKNEKKAKDFSNIRNLVIIHPLINESDKNDFPDRYIRFKKGESSWDPEITEENFEIASLSISHLSKEIKLNPYQDLKFLKDYLDEMGQLLGKFFISGIE